MRGRDGKMKQLWGKARCKKAGVGMTHDSSAGRGKGAGECADVGAGNNGGGDAGDGGDEDEVERLTREGGERLT